MKEFKELECSYISEEKFSNDYCGLKSTHFLKLKLYGIDLNILMYESHAEQLLQMYSYYKENRYEEMVDDRIPIMLCRGDGNHLYFYCKFYILKISRPHDLKIDVEDIVKNIFYVSFFSFMPINEEGCFDEHYETSIIDFAMYFLIR